MVTENCAEMLLVSVNVGLLDRTVPLISVVMKSLFNVLSCNKKHTKPQIFCIADLYLTPNNLDMGTF